MSILEQAIADFAEIVTDSGAFAVSALVTSPAGETTEVVGLFGDVAEKFEPSVGETIIGRRCSFSTRLDAFSGSIPVGVPERSSKPWTVQVSDAVGTTQLYRVAETRPDRTIGSLVLILEVHR